MIIIFSSHVASMYLQERTDVHVTIHRYIAMCNFFSVVSEEATANMDIGYSSSSIDILCDLQLKDAGSIKSRLQYIYIDIALS